MCAFGVDEVPRRLEACEGLIDGQRLSDELLGEVAQAAAGAVQPESDMHASADYRRRMTGVLARRALTEAISPDTNTEG
jgi:carbon-monoxide dehydrogenase medium subunit